jgi:hypothetical protein
MDQKNKLPAIVERLLIKVGDGEGSFIERTIASLLTSAHVGSREFSREMKVLGEKVKFLNAEPSSPKTTDLWAKIERRINEEERAAVYLGRRDVKVSAEEGRTSWLRQVLSPALFGGMAVGVATATIAFFAFKPGSPATPSFVSGAGIKVASNQIIAEQPPVDLVSFSSKDRNRSASRVDNREAFRNQRQVRLLKRMDPRIPFEVDWMKSDGKVSFIQDAQEGSTVIWVKRNDPATTPKVLEAEPRIVQTPR